jgi:hypothetical protein
MKPTSFIVNITSETPDKLIAFYRDVVELPPNPNIGEGAFEVIPGVSFIVDGHSETKGKAKEPQRVGRLLRRRPRGGADQAQVERRQVHPRRRHGALPWGGVISTFVDPDGNYCQLVQYKPE